MFTARLKHPHTADTYNPNPLGNIFNASSLCASRNFQKGLQQNNKKKTRDVKNPHSTHFRVQHTHFYCCLCALDTTHVRLVWPAKEKKNFKKPFGTGSDVPGTPDWSAQYPADRTYLRITMILIVFKVISFFFLLMRDEPAADRQIIWCVCLSR